MAAFGSIEYTTKPFSAWLAKLGAFSGLTVFLVEHIVAEKSGRPSVLSFVVRLASRRLYPSRGRGSDQFSGREGRARERRGGAPISLVAAVFVPHTHRRLREGRQTSSLCHYHPDTAAPCIVRKSRLKRYSVTKTDAGRFENQCPVHSQCPVLRDALQRHCAERRSSRTTAVHRKRRRCQSAAPRPPARNPPTCRGSKTPVSLQSTFLFSTLYLLSRNESTSRRPEGPAGKF